MTEIKADIEANND
jgi:hypothetical protein